MTIVTLQKIKPYIEDAKVVLDIGVGSGYMTLCIYKLMKSEESRVYGIDHIPGLVH